MPAENTIIVVPCFNEAKRLRADQFLRLAGEHRLVFADDGSTDETDARLRELARTADGRIEVLSLGRNRGKAEAVRLGMLRALELGASIAGYVDADLATSVEEISRLLGEMKARPEISAVMGARVALLGAQIERRQWRHYFGRLFATVASLILALPVYDTQCGAKFFRTSDRLRESLARPFRSRWAFDVELIGRLLTRAGTSPPLRRDQFLEIPLKEWTHVSGSKVGMLQGLKGGLDLLLIGADLYRERRRIRDRSSAQGDRLLP